MENSNLENLNRFYKQIDLNNLLDTTNGYCDGCTNAPVSGENGFIEVIRRHNTDIAMQRYTLFVSNRVYTRTYDVNNGWKPWVKHSLYSDFSTVKSD